MAQTVCFTGHRHVPDKIYAALAERLDAEIERQIAQGARHFRAGGALGFDTMAALAVLRAAKKHPDVYLDLILPCPTQTRGWGENDRHLYEQILALSHSHRYVSQSYFPGVLQLRNRALVEGADVCIAYLTTSSGGGAAFTASLALKSGLELVNLAEPPLGK